MKKYSLSLECGLDKRLSFLLCVNNILWDFLNVKRLSMFFGIIFIVDSKQFMKNKNESLSDGTFHSVRRLSEKVNKQKNIVLLAAMVWWRKH
ncbi:hypothetical protein [Limosilactobacillus frumenti]|nr:hypothetical protein [Limosilactobacillus frumenti]